MVIFDFLIIFITCLAIALFSLENTQDVALKILPQLEIEVHLAVALVVAMGIGATLAGLYMLWIKLKNNLALNREKRKIQDREQEIEELKQDMESRQAEIEKLRQEKLESQSIAEKTNSLEESYESDGNSIENSIETPVETN
ncbi:MAG: lipopolysaccharide assembly protein LapA domain-containing protein [Xenococcaceae cyanobacterium MO_207.B15]|nr:lipopolysaccharide assembly protein LapA domain-containing protein [Xenococcaceae cyanobacterium MO_207.B15]MDJ0745464.1 lipopolysaccharide assembly protein LapA domain-containing protein [Xenococcaceae cyanobacterium MO_167.B27]